MLDLNILWCTNSQFLSPQQLKDLNSKSNWQRITIIYASRFSSADEKKMMGSSQVRMIDLKNEEEIHEILELLNLYLYMTYVMCCQLVIPPV